MNSGIHVVRTYIGERGVVEFLQCFDSQNKLGFALVANIAFRFEAEDRKGSMDDESEAMVSKEHGGLISFIYFGEDVVAGARRNYSSMSEQ